MGRAGDRPHDGRRLTGIVSAKVIRLVLPREAQQRRLWVLVKEFVENRVPCPSCKNTGPHKDNGAKVDNLVFSCAGCGKSFHPEKPKV